MNKLVSKLFVAFVVAYMVVGNITAASAATCEKWKSEIAEVSMQLGGYVKAYSSYSNKKDEKTHQHLLDKSRSVLLKLDAVKSHVQDAPSCEHPDGKFEHRKTLLLDVLSKAKISISALNFLAPSVTESLEHE